MCIVLLVCHLVKGLIKGYVGRKWPLKRRCRRCTTGSKPSGGKSVRHREMNTRWHDALRVALACFNLAVPDNERGLILPSLVKHFTFKHHIMASVPEVDWSKAWQGCNGALGRTRPWDASDQTLWNKNKRRSKTHSMNRTRDRYTGSTSSDQTDRQIGSAVRELQASCERPGFDSRFALRFLLLLFYPVLIQRLIARISRSRAFQRAITSLSGFASMNFRYRCHDVMLECEMFHPRWQYWAAFVVRHCWVEACKGNPQSIVPSRLRFHVLNWFSSVGFGPDSAPCDSVFCVATGDWRDPY